MTSSPHPGTEDRRLRAFVDDVRALPRAAWVVYAGTFINRFGSFVVTFLILILVQRGLSPAQAGLAASAHGLRPPGAAALGRPAAGPPGGGGPHPPAVVPPPPRL